MMCHGSDHKKVESRKAMAKLTWPNPDTAYHLTLLRVVT